MHCIQNLSINITINYGTTCMPGQLYRYNLWSLEPKKINKDRWSSTVLYYVSCLEYKYTFSLFFDRHWTALLMQAWNGDCSTSEYDRKVFTIWRKKAIRWKLTKAVFTIMVWVHTFHKTWYHNIRQDLNK